MLNIFKTKSITDQLDNYIDYKKETRGWGTAVMHREWLTRFIAISRVEHISEVTIYHIDEYIDWVVGKYPNDYAKICALNALRCFFRFYKRYDIIVNMTKLGRKPNYEMIGIVKGMRAKNPPMPFRTIAEKIKKERGVKKVHLQSLFRWAHAKI